MTIMFSVDGVNFSTIGESLQIEETDYGVMPEYDFKFQAIPGYDEGTGSRRQVLSRPITLNVTFEKATAAEVRAAIDTWNALVGPHIITPQKLILDEWPDRYWKGFFKGASQSSLLTDKDLKMRLEFVALGTSYSIDAMGYPDVPPAVTTLTSNPQSFEINNTGSAFAYPHWLYTAVGNEDITLYNSVTNETGKYTVVSGGAGVLTEFIWQPYTDDYTEPYIVRHGGSVDMAAFNGPIPRLAPGKNIVLVTGAVGGSFRVYWRKRDY